ncbi:MAG: transcriptional regulator [Candidatus Zixiibacteriota bacterium]|nr:MAG: transcriptional regulator [candidate division Zixibacteria bacterium]
MSETSDHPDLIGDIDRLIHEPARYNVVALLYVLKSADFRFVQHQTGLTAGNLSAHLRKLKAAGYLKIDKGFSGNFPHTDLSLTAQGRRSFEKYRDRMKQALDSLPGK